MKRHTRKAIRNLTFFFLIFISVIYLTRTSTPKTHFPWTKITYQTTSPVPPAHGTCPGLKPDGKPALVVARISSDSSSWLKKLEHKYHPCIYTSDLPAPNPGARELRVPENRGHESMSYLTFLIDNYDSLPAATVFVHGSRYAWHNDHPAYDNLPLLHDLQIHKALAGSGYANLRCDWSLSTCPSDVTPQGGWETEIQAKLVPYDARAVSDAALPRALASLFGEGAWLGNGDAAVRSQCCAQFVVSRESVWRHSREEYVRVRQWLLDGSSSAPKKLRNRNAAPSDDRVAGRILSYVWHILFLDVGGGEGVDLGELNGRACPSANECYCRLYGRCGLEGCGMGGCRGVYSLPDGLRLPRDWEERHGNV